MNQTLRKILALFLVIEFVVYFSFWGIQNASLRYLRYVTEWGMVLMYLSLFCFINKFDKTRPHLTATILHLALSTAFLVSVFYYSVLY